MTTALIAVDGLSTKELDYLQNKLYVEAVEYAKCLIAVSQHKRTIIIDGTKVD